MLAIVYCLHFGNQFLGLQNCRLGLNFTRSFFLTDSPQLEAMFSFRGRDTDNPTKRAQKDTESISTVNNIINWEHPQLHMVDYMMKSVNVVQKI